MTTEHKPTISPQQTGTGKAIWTMYDAQAGLTTVFIPSVDLHGKHYVREIVVWGDNVLDLGRDQA